MAKRKTKARAPAASKITHTRVDSFVNTLTGVGARDDRRLRTRPSKPVILDDSRLTDLYRSGGIPRRTVDLLSNDACRNWFTVANDEDNKAQQHLEEIKAQERVTHGMQMARLYGGSVVVMIVDDGQALEEPVNEDRIRAVRGMTVFDKRLVLVSREDIDDDINSPFFGEPRMYHVYPLTGGERFDVHASRIIRFDGDTLGWREYQARGYWHDSVLQTAWESIRQLGAVMDSSEYILEQYVIGVMKIKGLMSMLMTKDGEANLKKRIRMIDQSLHVANLFTLDDSEEYTKHSASVAGVDRLLAHFELSFSAATGYPITLFFGRSPAGMNATGEADINFYYDRVQSWQMTDLKPRLEPLVRYIFKSHGFAEPESWSIVFNPLRQMTTKDMSELYKANAEADQMYLANQVLTPEAIGKHRFVGDKYNPVPPSISEENFEKEEAARQQANAIELERLRAQQVAAAANANGDGNEPPTPPAGEDGNPHGNPCPEDKKKTAAD